MKENSQTKTKSTLAALVLSLASLNAAEQEVSRTENALSSHQVRNDVKTRFTKEEVVDQISQGMYDDDKAFLINVLEHVPSDRYEDFIELVKHVTQGMHDFEKVNIISAIARVSPDHYADYIKIVNIFSQNMNNAGITITFAVVGKLSHELYTNTDFIDTVNQLSKGMYGNNKFSIIEAVGNINPDFYPFLKEFIRVRPMYFTYVPPEFFEQNIRPNMTQDQLKEVLEHFYSQSYRYAPDREQKNAFDIQKFARGNVVDESGQNKFFNTAVLEHVKKSIEGNVLNYNAVLTVLNKELNVLKSDPLKSSAIKDDIYRWIIRSNEALKGQDAIALVVSYLMQKDKTHQKLRTWLYALMDEYNEAYIYSKKNTKTIESGVITSLRSAIPEGDVVLEKLFKQAESSLMIVSKLTRLTDAAFWAKKFQAEGVTSTTPLAEAKSKFSEILHDYFEGITDQRAQPAIEAALDAFEDSQINDPSLKGLWSKIKVELLKLEQEQSARAE
ncbi:MAG: hypothetical protein NEHIOOID_00995 [Holosporales bacterium]